MARPIDVAAYILRNCGKMTALKLQKLVYYSQAWSLVWDSRPLFRARIEAWAQGPVVPALYNAHRGLFEVRPDQINGDPGELDDTAKETIDAVLKFYGDKTSQWLSDLTHMEQPWIHARTGLKPGERGRNEISLAVMNEYYSSLK